jgi:hypothetical protein
MSNLQILGTGCCGFLRIYDMLKPHINIRYKGGKRKYQNGFEIWNPSTDLIWDSEILSPDERKARISSQDFSSNISHIGLKWVSDFLSIDSGMKFLCLKGDFDFTVKCLLSSWGYRNPCFVKERGLGIGKNRYTVDQFPNFSEDENEFTATVKYVNLYNKISEALENEFPDNFKIVESPRFFSDENYQKSVLSFVGLSIPFYCNPPNYESFDVTTTLHGGLGNNLFQMAEIISFCEKYDLPDPVFGTWDLWDNPGFPKFYNCDLFLGGHSGSQNDLIKTFPNLNWKENLISNFDTKFSVNDMFRFGELKKFEKVKKSLKLKNHSLENFASLHLRFCTLQADTHVKEAVQWDFYDYAFSEIPKDIRVMVFSDNENLALESIENFKSRYQREFELQRLDAFRSLELMASCKYNMMNVSTFSFWGAFLLSDEIEKKIYCPKAFVRAHGNKMIPEELEWKIF